jgi:RNA polymerase sigma-70 factor (ECF subfamily)
MRYSDKRANDLISSQERTRLVALCATITGRGDVAEDLAQETLLEAWHHFDQLRDPEKRLRWLAGIARNVCLRWMRRSSRDRISSSSLEPPDGQEADVSAMILADAFDLEVEFERKELILLLEQALALLPPQTRIALVRHYIDEIPLAEIAHQLGMNASAIAMRLQRGKQALRRILATNMQDEIAPYGFSRQGKWEEMHLWCDLCGQHRLRSKLDPMAGSLVLMCPACCSEPTLLESRIQYPALLQGMTSSPRTLARLDTAIRTYYQKGLATGSAPCLACTRSVLVRHFHPGEAPNWRNGREHGRICGSEQRHGIAFPCLSCGYTSFLLSKSVLRWVPEVKQFYQRYQRVRALPEHEIEVDGQIALVTRLESVTQHASLDIVTALDTYEVLLLHGRRYAFRAE